MAADCEHSTPRLLRLFQVISLNYISVVLIVSENAKLYSLQSLCTIYGLFSHLNVPLYDINDMKFHGLWPENFKRKSKEVSLLSLYAANVGLPVTEATERTFESDMNCIPCTHSAGRYVEFALRSKLHRH